ncbi:MAG TPA: fused MFS/spermidine synthase [Acidimicrobiales bacterium]|nr:fused MFS/spermidine synthase [Acidimicrobiales bacterium]
MAPLLAGGLVFVTSAAVLVLEILAVRLLAPYAGLTLETYTAIIGTMLAGIAAGTWIGGYAADRLDPRRMLGPLMVGGGALAAASVPLVRLLGGSLSEGGGTSVMPLSFLAFFAPSAVLSAVSPTIVKLQLRDLRVTGRVVGRLSALGTAGAIIGTFLAGFVLIDVAPTTASVVALGGLFVAAGAALWVWLSTDRTGTVVVALVAALLATGASATAGDVCDTETKYHCVRIVPDDRRPGGRLLVLDTLRHSYVDVDDPTYLEFRYTKVFADVIDAVAPDGALDAVHVGGGGFTLPRYLSAVRPGSTNVVLEIDPGLVDVARRRLGLTPGPTMDVRVGDGRLLIDDLSAAAHDIVLGDAFGGVAVPWHLTTVEFVAAVGARLRPGGAYVLNVIDLPPLRFARAEVATLQRVFGHVAVIAPPALLEGEQGGNFVLVASDVPIDAAGITGAIRARGGAEQVATGEAAAAFAGDAPILTDDHAPVDQWLARARRPRT